MSSNKSNTVKILTTGEAIDFIDAMQEQSVQDFSSMIVTSGHHPVSGMSHVVNDAAGQFLLIQ